ncbi:MAG: RluA family pseudouridine synthase, partial [Desulfobacterales bacterium]|nr:RluA family pseudouridine synthase [Desulfobacterales bacterium]
CSRSYAASIIRDGHIRVNGALKKPGYRIRSGDRVAGNIPPPATVSFEPEPMDLAVLYEDQALIVINKPPGMVVHPAPGNYTGTLVNGLLHHCPDLAPIAGEIRPGIVHRLDKDTSGTIIVAKNAGALENLAGQFKARTVEKTYLAVVYGDMKSETGEIDLPVGRHPTERKKMSVKSRSPRSALTLWRVKANYGACCLLEVDLKTGRTHQIRVHCAAIQHPIIGDALYGGRTGNQYRRQDSLLDTLARGVERQMLHAWRLTVTHPETGERLMFEAPLLDDMRSFIKGLE